jgi:hypothetical protein
MISSSSAECCSITYLLNGCVGSFNSAANCYYYKPKAQDIARDDDDADDGADGELVL